MRDLFLLKHKDVNTAVLDLETTNAVIFHTEVLDSTHLPIPGDPKGLELSRWLFSRAIPSGRQELTRVLQRAGCSTPAEYLVKNLALSLTDCFWLCPAALPNVSWKDVSPYQRSAKIVTFHTGNGRAFYTGHDSSVGGSLPKRAVQRNGQWFLQKYDPYSDGLRNVNEAFAAYLHQLQGFSRYTPYKTGTDQNGRSFCECPYFTDETHELVSAADIVSTCYGKDTVSNFVNVCSENGLSRDEVEQFLDYQTLTDFLISNTDRHPDNFGILRDPDTMRFLSMAPIYDSGTSMGCNGRILSDRQLLYGETNNVIPAFAEALKRVHNRNAVDLSHVPDKTAVLDFYLDHGVSRLEACKIAALYGRKVKMLSEFQGGKNIEELIPERGEPER